MNLSTEDQRLLEDLCELHHVSEAKAKDLEERLVVVQDGKNVPESLNFSGGELKRPTFFGNDELFIRSLLAHVHEKAEINEDVFFSNKSLIKNHIDQGSLSLEQMYIENGTNADSLIKHLVNLVEFQGRKELRGKGLDIFIGRTLLQKSDLVMQLNNTDKHANSHLAIMGKPGVGKTQFLLKILADIRIQSNYQTHFIYFDYKGDVVENERFLEVAKAQPFRLLQGNQRLPINPFVLPAYDEQTINISALIDVHAMPVLKELVAYLVIERLYKEMALLPDSPVDEGKRTIRTILVIDEAHNYLSQKNMFLQRIIREGRSKGIVVFFASQSPNDYQQKFFNFQELLEFTYIFQCDGVSASSIQDILGCSSKTAKDLQTEISRQEPWQVISRAQIKTEEYVKFEAEAFYKNY